MTSAGTILAEVAELIRPSRAGHVNPLPPERYLGGVQRTCHTLKMFKVKGHGLAEDHALKREGAVRSEAVDIRLARNGAILLRRGVVEATTDCESTVVSMGTNRRVIQRDERKGRHASSRRSKSQIEDAYQGWRTWRRYRGW